MLAMRATAGRHAIIWAGGPAPALTLFLLPHKHNPTAVAAPIQGPYQPARPPTPTKLAQHSSRMASNRQIAETGAALAQEARRARVEGAPGSAAGGGVGERLAQETTGGCPTGRLGRLVWADERLW